MVLRGLFVSSRATGDSIDSTVDLTRVWAIRVRALTPQCTAQVLPKLARLPGKKWARQGELNDADDLVFVRHEDLDKVYVHVEQQHGEAQGSVQVRECFFKKSGLGKWLGLGTTTEQHQKVSKEQPVRLMNADGKVVGKCTIEISLVPLQIDDGDDEDGFGSFSVHIQKASVAELGLGLGLALAQAQVIVGCGRQEHATSFAQVRDQEVSWNQSFEFYHVSESSGDPLEITLVMEDGAKKQESHTAYCAVTCSDDGSVKLLNGLVTIFVSIDCHGFRAIPKLIVPKKKSMIVLKRLQLANVVLNDGDSITLHLGQCSTEQSTAISIKDMVVVPSSHRRNQGSNTFDVNVKYHGGLVLFIADNICLELLKLNLASATDLICFVPLNLNGSWVPFTCLGNGAGGYSGEACLEIDIVPYENEHDVLRAREMECMIHRDMLYLSVMDLEGIQANSQLGSNLLFLEIEIAYLPNSRLIGTSLTRIWQTKTLGKAPPYNFQEQFPIPMNLLSNQGDYFLQIHLKTSRDVIIAASTIQIDSFLVQEERTLVFAPMHFQLGKAFLSILIHNDPIAKAIKTASTERDSFNMTVCQARNLRVGKGSVRVHVESIGEQLDSNTNNEVQTYIRSVQPKNANGSASNPKFDDSFSISSTLTLRDQVHLVSLGVFSESQVLGSINIPFLKSQDEPSWFPLISKGKSAGEVQIGFGDAATKPTVRNRRTDERQEEMGNDDVLVFIKVIQAQGISTLCNSTLDAAVKLKNVDSHEWHMTKPTYGIGRDRKMWIWDEELGPFHAPRDGSKNSNSLSLKVHVLNETVLKVQKEKLLAGILELDLESDHRVQLEFHDIDGWMEFHIRKEKRKDFRPQTGLSLLPRNQQLSSTTKCMEMELWLPVDPSNDSSSLIHSVVVVMKSGLSVHLVRLSRRKKNSIVFLGVMTINNALDQENRLCEKLLIQHRNSANTILYESVIQVKQYHDDNANADDRSKYEIVDASSAKSLLGGSIIGLHLSSKPFHTQLLNRKTQPEVLKFDLAQAEMESNASVEKNGLYDVRVTMLGTQYDESSRTRLICPMLDKNPVLLFWGESFAFQVSSGNQPVAFQLTVSGYKECGTRFLRMEHTVSFDEVFSKGKLWVELHKYNCKVQLGVSSTRGPGNGDDVEQNEQQHDEQFANFMEAFRKYDTDGDGSIPIHLVGQLVQEQLSFMFPDSKVQDLSMEIAILDTDGDGVVTMDEYLDWIRKKRTGLMDTMDEGESEEKTFQINILNGNITRKVPARVFLKFGNGEKFATEQVSGPQMAWNDPQVFHFQVPARNVDTEKVSLSIVENGTGKRVAWKNDVPLRSLLANDETVAENHSVELSTLPIRICVVIVKAQNLRAADVNGLLKRKAVSSDPYCIVKIAGLTKKTKVIKKNLDPVWNESLIFDVNPNKLELDSFGHVIVKIQVNDHDMISFKDDFLGECQVSCGPDAQEQEIKLSGKKASGNLHVRTKVEQFEEGRISLKCVCMDTANAEDDIPGGVVTLEKMEKRIKRRAELIDFAFQSTLESTNLLRETERLQKAMTLTAQESKSATSPFFTRETVARIGSEVGRLAERIEALESSEVCNPVFRKEVATDVHFLHQEVQSMLSSFVRSQMGTLFRQVYDADVFDPLLYDQLLQMSEQLGRFKLRFPTPILRTSAETTTTATTTNWEDQMPPTLPNLSKLDVKQRREKLEWIQSEFGIDFEGLYENQRRSFVEQAIFHLLYRFVTIPDLEGLPPTEQEKAYLINQMQDINRKVKGFQQLQGKSQLELEQRKADLNEAIRAANNDLLSRFSSETFKPDSSRLSDLLYVQHISNASSKRSVDQVMSELENRELAWQADQSHGRRSFRCRCRDLLDRLEDCGAPKGDSLCEYISKCLEQDWKGNEELLRRNTVSNIDLQVLLLFGAVEEKYVDAFDIVNRYIFAGGSGPDITPDKVSRAIMKRLVFDERKSILDKILSERIPHGSIQINKTGLFKSFVVGTHERNADLLETARTVAAAIVKKEYISYEDLKTRFSGQFSISIKDYKFAVEGIRHPNNMFQVTTRVLDAGKSEVVTIKSTILKSLNSTIPLTLDSLADVENQVMEVEVIPRLEYPDDHVYRHRLTLQPSEFVRKTGIPVGGWFRLSHEIVPRKLQGFVEIEIVDLSVQSDETYYLFPYLKTDSTKYKNEAKKWIVKNKRLVSQEPRRTLVFPGFDVLDDIFSNKEQEQGMERATLVQVGFRLSSSSDSAGTSVDDDASNCISPKPEEQTVDLGNGSFLKARVTMREDPYAMHSVRVEHAATKVAASYRGHRVRKRNRTLGRVDCRISGNGFINSMGNETESLSSRVKVFLLDNDEELGPLGSSTVSHRSGAAPTFEPFCFDVPAIGNRLKFVVYESQCPDLRNDVIGTWEVDKKQFLDTVVGTEDSELKVLHGGIRAKAAKDLTLHVVRAKFKNDFAAQGKYYVSIDFGYSARARGNKKQTGSKTKNDKIGMIEWNEGFNVRNQDHAVKVHDTIEVRLIDESSGEVVENLSFALFDAFDAPKNKFTGWLKGDRCSILVKCSLDNVADDEKFHASLSFKNTILANKENGKGGKKSHKETNASSSSVRIHEPGVFHVNVIEAENLGTVPMRPRVSATLLPWASSLAHGSTMRCWSDGKHAKWTKTESNLIDLAYPGCGNEAELEETFLELDILSELDTVLGMVRIPAKRFILGAVGDLSKPTWYDLEHRENRTRVRLKISFESKSVISGKKTWADRVCLTVRFDPDLSQVIQYMESGLKKDQVGENVRDFHRAIKFSDVEKVKTILDTDPEVLSLKGRFGRTALHVAVLAKGYELVKLLLERGADATLLDDFGKSPEQYVQNMEMAKALGTLHPESVLIDHNTQYEGMKNILKKIEFRKSSGKKESSSSSSSGKKAGDPLLMRTKNKNITTNNEQTESTTSLISAQSSGMTSSVNTNSTATFNTLDDNQHIRLREHSEEEIREEIGTIIKEIIMASSADEVFNLFDMDDDGFLDQDEFEGSVRVALDIMDPMHDNRMPVIRAIAKELCNDSENRSCSLKRFADFFQVDRAHRVRRRGSLEITNSLEMELEKIDFPVGSEPDHVWELVREMPRFKNVDFPQFEEALNLLETLENQFLEKAVAKFVEMYDPVQEWFERPMNQTEFIELFCEIVQKDGSLYCTHGTNQARLKQRLAERFGIKAGELLIMKEAVESVVAKGGKASDTVVQDANDKLLQFIVDFVREDRGVSGSFKVISRKIFESLDLSGDGWIDRFEFHSFMREVGVTDTSASDQLFELVDSDSDGRANVEEFVKHVESFIHRKRAALQHILNNLRTNRVTGGASFQERGAPRLDAKVWQIQKLRRHNRQGKSKPMFLRKNRDHVTFHNVEWVAVVKDETAKRFQEWDVVGYDEFSETLMLRNGSMLLLGRDPVHAIWGKDRFSAKENAELLHKLQIKVDGLKLIEDNAALKIQRLFQRNSARLDAQRVVNDRKIEIARNVLERDSATIIQRAARGKLARKRRRRLEALEATRRELHAKREKATLKMQAQVRGYLVRHDVMAIREKRREKAATQIQARGRGFLIRSAEQRQTKQEHESILAAVRAPFLKGLQSKLSIDMPRVSRDLVRFQLFLPSLKMLQETTQHYEQRQQPGQKLAPIYALETSPEGTTTVDYDALLTKVYNVLKAFGVTQPEKQLGIKFFKNTRGEKTFANVFKKTLESNDERFKVEMVGEIAVGLNSVLPIHQVATVKTAILDAITGGPDTSSNPFKSYEVFRYVQSSYTQSHAWAQIVTMKGKRARSKALRLDMFQKKLTDEPVLEDLRNIALVAAELDFYGIGRALFSDTLQVEKIDGSYAHLTAHWFGTKFQIQALLTFAKRKMTTVYNPAVPPRPLCRRATVENILCVTMNKENVEDPLVHKIDFFDVNIATDLGKTLQRAIWLPPVNARPFAERVYALQDLLELDADANDPNNHGGSGRNFERVLWLGRLLTNKKVNNDEDVEPVSVDAWRELPSGETMLRLSVHGGTLGWFTIPQCKSMLRLDCKVDRSKDDMFERICNLIAPFDESGRILTSALGFLREKVAAHGARRAFLKMTSDKILDQTELSNALKSRYGVWEHLCSEVDDESEVGFLFARFLTIFPEPLDLNGWEFVIEPPEMDIMMWLQELTHGKEGGLLYLRAKFHLLDQPPRTGQLKRHQIVEVLSSYFGEEGVTEDLLMQDIQWAQFQHADGAGIDYNRFLARLEERELENNTDSNNSDEKDGSKRKNDGDDDEDEDDDDESDEEEEDVDDRPTKDEVLDLLVDSDEDDDLGAEFLRDRSMRNALAELRYVILEYSNEKGTFDLEKAFRVFDQDGTGQIDTEEFKAALAALDIEKVLPTDQILERFISYLDIDRDGQINYNEFLKMAGHNRSFPKSVLRSLKRQHRVQTIRWEVELYVVDLQLWVPGVASKYREFDHAVKVELRGRKGIYPQNVGFLQLDDYPIFLKRNVWGGKPWGRDPLWRETVATRKVENSKATLKREFIDHQGNQDSDVE